ncbi:MAG: MBL fold metallo-hydrolase [Clostridia bacterium]|nr:MBL fold metallo-hydrolase [Clostridia bacterium]
MKDISIRYLGGSGFLVWYDETGFLFDASSTGADERILPDAEMLSTFERLYVFVSHNHEEHFDPEIYSIVPENTRFFLGFDLPESCEGIHMNPGDEVTDGDLTVTACDSTDEGVSFLISISGITLFHAGNLNLWHWRDESTIVEIEAAERDFYRCLDPLIREKTAIDIAFFPVDPRQGRMHDAGAVYFLMNLKPRILIPMHFQGRGDVVKRFAMNNENSTTKVMTFLEAGEQGSVSIPESEGMAPDQKLLDFLRDHPIEENSDDQTEEEKEPEETAWQADPPESDPD